MGQVLKVKIIILLLLTTCGLAGVHRVPSDYPTIQAGIDASTDGDTVLVAPGTYTGDGNRDIDFKGKAITVKSEHGPQTCIIDCNGTEEEPHRGFYFHNSEDENSVLQGFTITKGFAGQGGAVCCDGSSPTIRNCTITSNSARLWDDGGFGGGIYCADSNAVIEGCKIIDNIALGGSKIAARGYGGGIFCAGGCPTITDCEIYDNCKDSGSAWLSGAIHSSISDITISSCRLNNNESNGIYFNGGKSKVTNCLIANSEYSGIRCRNRNDAFIEKCRILENRAEGINCYSSNETIVVKCLVAGNMEGGIITGGFNRITLKDCTITDNSAWNRGAGIYCGGVSCSVRNCILWGNQPHESQIWLNCGSIDDGPYLCTVSYSNVQGAEESVGIAGDFLLDWGEGNIDLNPCFVITGYIDNNGTLWSRRDDFWILGDYHLKSQAGRYNPNSESWVIDDVTSPCIDAGDPNSPIELEPFPNGGRINMGAYGGTAEASKSYFGEPLCETIIAGDINGDCKVDFTDFVIMASHWFEER